jgi:transposase
MKDELLENNVVSLHNRGWSMRRLSREFGVSRQRVVRILEQNVQKRKNGTGDLSEPIQRGSMLDSYKEQIANLLEKYKRPPITNQRIFELLEEKGYQGKITILRNYLAQVRGKKVKDPIVCVETNPGQRASHDWSDYYVDFTDGSGSEKITFLSYILNYSRRQYIEVVDDKSRTTLLRCLVNAFVYFDGVPKEIKSDNQKACVDRWELGSPVFNKDFLSFATHYQFRPLTINPGKPRENLKVERPFYYLETNFLNGRKFQNRQDIKEQLQTWLLGRNDQRIHRTTKQKPIDLYSKMELPALQLLPSKHYDTSVIEYRIVNNESVIQWSNFYYHVPSQYMYETCPVRISDGELTIYSPSCQQIARYPLAEKDRTDRYIGRKKKSKKYILTTSEVLTRLDAFGPAMHEYIQLIKTAKQFTYRHHWHQILSLKVNYRAEDILLAVKRALRFRVFEAQAIVNFLKVNAEKKSEITFSSKDPSNGQQ